MTQRIFDIENEKDMQDLWDILPDECMRIVTHNGIIETCHGETIYYNNIDFKHIIKINWHDKTEITRPIQEATKEDVDKLCVFWNYGCEMEKDIGLLEEVGSIGKIYKLASNLADELWYDHARRLTKQEIEEICL